MLVHKIDLALINGIEEVELPFNTGREARANVMSVGLQFEVPRLWYNVKRDEYSDFVIITIGTGHDWGNKLTKEEHIGSVVLEGSGLVWHYFLLSRKEFEERFASEINR
ncbi:MAG: hypothetical protein IKY94_05165 [Lachnospiraceae bacterium]|nr:hypothetical protein [Lachnospiraceae bacterium]